MLILHMNKILNSILKVLETQKEFIKRIYSFFIIKVGLVLTRWSLIIISYHKLDSKNFALLASTYSLIEILRIVAEFGTEGFIYSRLIRKKPASKIVYSLIELRLLLSIILSITFIAIGLNKYSLNKMIIFALLPLFSIESSSFIFLQKNNKVKELSKISIASLAILILIYFYLHARLVDLDIMTTLFVIPDFIITGLCLFFTKENWVFVNLNIVSILKKNKKIIKYIIPSGLVGIIVICYSRLDLILALPLLGQQVQAIYSYAFRFVEPFAILTSLFTISFLTEIGNKNNEKFFNNYIQILRGTTSTKNFLSSLILSLIISTSLSLFADLIMQFHHKMLIFILSIGIILRFINSILISFFFRTSRYWDLLKIVIVNFIAIISLGFLLVNYLGVIGIAYASLLGEIYLFITQKKYITKIIAKN